MYITKEGPFDGVMAFSLGAALVATLMIRNSQQDLTQPRVAPLFKCAIFLSGGIPFDNAALLQGKVQTLDAGEGEIIQIPTAHIWGSNDVLSPGTSSVLSMMCSAQLRTILIHDGGHEVPGARSKDAVTAAVHVIRRSIDRALSD